MDVRVPASDPDTVPFWEFARRNELRLQRCTSCGMVRWPPGPVCPDCWGFNAEWARLSGRGRLLSWVTFRRRYLDDFDPPYVVAMVRLEEGPVYQARLVDPPESLHHGLPVRVLFERVGETVVLPQFQIAKDPEGPDDPE